MKHIIMGMLMLGLGFKAAGQNAGALVGGGYTMGFYNNLNGLNQVVDDYNNSRNWLTTKMPHFGMMQGVVADATIFFGSAAFKFGWTGNHETHLAQGIDNTGKMGIREIKVLNNVINMGVGFGNAKNRVGFMIFGSMNIGFAPQFTRTYYQGEKVPDFYKVPLSDNADISLALAPEFYLKTVKGIYLVIKPYYEYNFMEYSFASLHEEVNNPGIGYDDTPYKCTPSHVGIDFKIMFGGPRLDNW